MSDALLAALEPLVRRVRTDVTAIRGAKGPVWTGEPLTPARLAKHLNGGPARGVCPIKAGENTTMVAVLDLDSHKGESTWDEMATVAEQVAGALVMSGMPPNPWRSGGGNGIHLILLWDCPQDAYSVRQALAEVLAECGYANGTGGVAKGQIEIFPKQDAVPADGFGNQFFMPLGGKSEPLIPALGFDPGGRDAAVGMRWLISQPVPVLEKPVRNVSDVVASGDTDRLRAALAAIPNDGPGLDYDEWRNIIFAIGHATNGDGLGLAHEFSARSDKYDPDFLDNRVWPYVKADGGITEATIYAKAREVGWDLSAAPDEFPVADVAVEKEPEAWPAFSRTKDGRIESTATNAQAALERSDFSGYQLGFDAFMGRRVIAEHGQSAWRPFKDSDYFEIRVALEKRGFKAPSQDLVREAVRCVSEARTFDNAIQWGAGLRWDGVPRVERFFSRYVGVADSAYARSVGLYLWTALAGRCMDPGCKVDMVPVLIGAQGSGKTSLVEALAPTEEAFIEINLAQRNEDQTARALRGKLVGELAELRGLAGRDAEDIKAWLTRRYEEIRALYAEYHSKYPRRLVMIGTGNNPEFLNDDSGERRWLPIAVGATDLDSLRTDRDQLWAEGIVLWKQGGVRWRDAQTLALGQHAKFKVSDPWEDAITAWFDSTDLDGAPVGPLVSVNDVMVGALRIPVDRVGKREEMRVARVLKALGFVKVEIWERGKSCKKWKRAANSAFELV